MLWLGERSGYLTDWVTQQWVKLTGRSVHLADHPWLDGPVGNTRIIGKTFFRVYAEQHGLELVESGTRGLMEDFSTLAGRLNDPSTVSPAVHDFYERTSAYELDAWAEWHTLFRPFGNALALLFSRRLQQLNVPLSSLDSSKGMSSAVLQMRDRLSGRLIQTAWVRELHATHNVIYAGSYSTCVVPGFDGICVKVVFPLPNGNAIVLMKPESHADGSFSLLSAGERFGDPGFYFVVHGKEGIVWARYVRAMQERITVYAAENNMARADHVLRFWGKEFLRLHYRMRLAP
ncbi:MAG TPA: hypothetical protein VHW46_08400 [Terracidiphilus sp.]|nr:hypothetical protein [Terracidiphilus sp.]